MRNRKLFHLLSLLGESEQKRLSLFLQSPCFNSSKVMVLFWEQWQAKIYPLAEGEDLSDESFVSGSQLKISRVPNLCTQMYGLAKRFLAIEEMEKHAGAEEVFFSKAVLDRDPTMQNQHRFVPASIAQVRAQPDSPEKFLGLCYLKLQLNRARVAARKTGIAWQEEFQQMHQLLEAFYLSKGLQLSSGAMNAGYVFRLEQPPENPFYRTYLDHPGTQAPTLLTKVYQLTLSLQLAHNNGPVLEELLQTLRESGQLFSTSVRKDVYGHVLNYCIRQINIGNDAFLHHTFEVYVHLLEQGELLHLGRLSPQQYKNINALACRLGHVDWANSFLEDYQPLLADQHNGLALAYNQAVLNFHKGDYRQSIRLLRPVVRAPHYDLFYGLDARSYLWKAYFELYGQLSADEVDEMMRLYDSFRLFVDRNEKISPLHQVQYRNLVRHFKRFIQLLEITSPGARFSALSSFYQELQGVQDLANKTWFFQKIECAIQDAKT